MPWWQGPTNTETLCYTARIFQYQGYRKRGI
jgi:hypothetical protein